MSRAGGNLKPFPKGTSGNPSGRPRTVGVVQDLARVYTEEAIKTLAAIMKDVDAPAAARVAAAEKILDRGYGKATQVIAGDEDGGPIHKIITVQFVDPDPVTIEARFNSPKLIEG